jgi:hypothetical protein
MHDVWMGVRCACRWVCILISIDFDLVWNVPTDVIVMLRLHWSIVNPHGSACSRLSMLG